MRMPVPTLRTRDLDPFEGFRRDFDDLWADFGRQLPFAWSAKADKGGVAALDVADVRDQLRWFKDQGLVKGDADAASLIDTRFLPVR